MRRAKPVCNFNSNRRQRTWQKKINLKQQHRLPPVPRPPVLAAANVAVVLVAVAAAVAAVVVAAASAAAVVVAVPVQVATVMVRPATK